MEQDLVKGAKQWFQGKELDARPRLSEVLHTRKNLPVFDAGSQPNIGRPIQVYLERQYPLWSFREDLESVMSRAVHRVKHTLDEVLLHLFVKKV